MMKSKLNSISLILLIALLSGSQFSFATPLFWKKKKPATENHKPDCESLVLGLTDYRGEGDRFIPIRQGVCQQGGTCYLEAALSALEDIIQQKLGYAASISRAKATADVIIDRAKNTMSPEDIDHLKPFGTRGLDMMSSGLVKNAIRLMENSEVLVLLPKSQKDVVVENELIQILHNRAGVIMFEYKNKLKELVAKDEPLDQLMAKYYRKLTDLHRWVMDAIIEYENAKREKLNQSMQRGQFPFLSQNDIVKLTIAGNSQVIHPLDQEETGDLSITNYQIKQAAEQRLEEKGLYTQHKTWKSIEKMIIAHIQRGIGIPLSFFYMNQYYNKDTQIWQIPSSERPVTAVPGETGAHAVNIIGYRLGSEGRIEHLLVRDSNDVRPRHMHINFAKEYAINLIFFDTEPIQDQDTVMNTLRLQDSPLKGLEGTKPD